MCEFGNNEFVSVKVVADLSHTNKEYWIMKKIDSCIAPIVRALQEGGIDMRGSCCGHGKGDGEIVLQDGSVLIIKSDLKKSEEK